MMNKRQMAENLLNRLETLLDKHSLDPFERDLLEDLLERFIREEKAKEETVKLERKGKGTVA